MLAWTPPRGGHRTEAGAMAKGRLVVRPYPWRQLPMTLIMAVATALVPSLGYAKVSDLARQSVLEDRPLIEILDETAVLSPAEARERIEESTRMAV